MPSRPLGPCSYPGCPQLAASHGRCGEHQREQRRAFDQARGTASQRGYDAEWRRVRAEVLQAQPFCAQCGEPATDVHHADRRYVPGTDHRTYRLEALCHAHHSAVTSRQVR